MKNRPETYTTHAGEQNAEKKNDAGRFLELIESVLAGRCRKWTQTADMKLQM